LAAFTTQLAAPHISGKNVGWRVGNVRQLQEIMARCAMKRSGLRSWLQNETSCIAPGAINSESRGCPSRTPGLFIKQRVTHCACILTTGALIVMRSYSTIAKCTVKNRTSDKPDRLILFSYRFSMRMNGASTMGASAKSERMELRISPHDKQEIEQAAQLSRVSVSQFIADSARERAEQIINEHKRIQLTEASYKAVMEALENPPEPNERLRRAADLSRKDSTWEWKR